MNKYDMKPDWFWLGMNIGITLNDIINNQDFPWEWRSVSQNPNVTMKTVEDNSELPWNWNVLPGNPNFNLEMVYKYPDKNWEFGNQTFSGSKCLTVQFILDFPTPKWNNFLTLLNPNISIKFILDNNLHQYTFDGLNTQPYYNYYHYYNPNYTLEMIEDFIQDFKIKHPKYKIEDTLEWDRIMSNPNITIEFIEKYEDIIKFRSLTWNKFTEQNKFINKLL